MIERNQVMIKMSQRNGLIKTQ